MKLHSNFVYLLVALLLMTYSCFFMVTYFDGKFHFLISTLLSISISILLFLSCKLIVKFELNFYFQILFFIIIAELLKIFYFFCRGQVYNSEDIFTTDFFVFTVFNASAIFLTYLIANSLYLISINENEIIYKTIWGEVDSFNLKQIDFLEVKSVPFWIPKFANRYIKHISITWQAEDMYTISFFSKFSIHNVAVLDLILEKSRALGNLKIKH